ncbi:MAG: hypothetical protein JWN25_2081 [Verrucomicrobiales bacterium]|jgi:hypothetical protein|nr:hypothetical protein [Verrucomicrobiales bacterium]MDB6129893.1 hypothetical protein [Verrucomicrobiales bacterium]
MPSSLNFTKIQIVLVILLTGGIFFLLFWDGPHPREDASAPPEVPSNPGPIRWAEHPVVSSPKLSNEVVQVILAQLKAARSNDFATALGLASTSFQMQFTIPQFGEMITTRFKPTTTWTNVSVESVLNNSTISVAEVDLQGPDPVVYQYFLTQENKEWRVLGVVPVRMRDLRRSSPLRSP